MKNNNFRKSLWTLLAMSLVQPVMGAPDDFIFTIDTRFSSGAESFTIPVYGPGVKYDVDCDDDGMFEAFSQSAAYTCEYAIGGENTIVIRDAVGDGSGFPRFRADEFGEAHEIIELNNWGSFIWDSMESAFREAVNMSVTASDWPNLSQVISTAFMFTNAAMADPDTSDWDTQSVADMRNMFFGATIAKPDTSGWDTSNVTDMSFMFLSAGLANPDTSGWNTSNVTDMNNMFSGAFSADPDTSSWITNNVTNMRAMFSSAMVAMPDTSGWDVSNVSNMSFMFSGARMADPDVSGWDTINVTDMNRMFSNADVANPDTNGWETTNVTNMNRMFNNAVMANPDTSNWDIAGVTDMQSMFNGVTLPTASYYAILMNFSSQTVQSDVQFSGGESQYCASDAHDILINTYGWSISDGGLSSQAECDEIDVIFRDSFEALVITFKAADQFFRYDFKLLENIYMDSFPQLIAVGLDNEGTQVIKFHLRKVDDALQIRISDLNSQVLEHGAIEGRQWTDHQWQFIDEEDLTKVIW